MSSSMLNVSFAFADSNYKNYSFGPFAVNSDAVVNFKSRIKKFNSVDETSQKKFTNLAKILKSDNGAELSGVKVATIVTSQTRRIFDSSTYGG